MKFFDDDGASKYYRCSRTKMDELCTRLENQCREFLVRNEDISTVELRLMSDYLRSGINMVFMAEIIRRRIDKRKRNESSKDKDMRRV